MWSCCPGNRTDVLTGSVGGSKIAIYRQLGTCGVRCDQVFKATLSSCAPGSGTFSGLGVYPAGPTSPNTFTIKPKRATDKPISYAYKPPKPGAHPPNARSGEIDSGPAPHSAFAPTPAPPIEVTRETPAAVSGLFDGAS